MLQGFLDAVINGLNESYELRESNELCQCVSIDFVYRVGNIQLFAVLIARFSDFGKHFDTIYINILETLLSLLEVTSVTIYKCLVQKVQIV